MTFLRRFGPYLLIGLIVFLFSIFPQEEPFQTDGFAKVIDGDSLRIDGVEVRLVGIDAPEGAQTCQKAQKTWACGRRSASMLRQMVRGDRVICKGDDYDRYSRLLGVCYLLKKEAKGGRVNINKWMVLQGWAVSYGRYFEEERKARRGKRGIWSSRFDMPRDWRRAHKFH